MSEIEPWTRQLLSVIVSQLCKTIGWHSVSTSCLQILVDVLHRYLKQLGTTVHGYTEHYNHSFPALEEVLLAFNDMGINVDDLKEYVDYVTPILIKEKVPQYPLEKKSNLNFLKPGSREVVTRPVHIHEYLPAMYPDMSDEYDTPAPPSQDSFSKENILCSSSANSLPSLSSLVGSCSSSASSVVKPGVGDAEMIPASNKRIQQLMSEEIGRPLRELSCIMMTTSGFLSPAREGKAPEARVPKPLSNYNAHSSSNHSNYINNNNINNNATNNNGNMLTNKEPSLPGQPAESKSEHKEHKKHSHSKSSKSAERKAREELHHNGHEIKAESTTKVKKLASGKETSKLKVLKPVHKLMENNAEADVVQRPPKPEKMKIPPPTPAAATHKEPKSVSTLKPKPEKAERAPPSPAPPAAQHPVFDDEPERMVEKLTTEPNKSKLNILKRLTKIKEDRTEPATASVPSPPAPAPAPALKNNHVDKNAQINECIEAVIKRSREKEEFNQIRDQRDSIFSNSAVADSHEIPPPSPPFMNVTASRPAPTTKQIKQIKRKKKQKFNDIQPTKKKIKLNHHAIPPRQPAPPSPPPSFYSDTDRPPKPAMEPEPPPFPFFSQGFMPTSLSQNLLIPRPHPFLHFPKVGDPNGPHPEMPNLPLPPPTLMQPPPHQPLNNSNHKLSNVFPPPPGPTSASSSKKAALVAAEADKNDAEHKETMPLSDKKLKKKMKKDKREKDKKKREKKEKLKNKEKLQKKKDLKKDLKKLKTKKEKVKKKQKLAAATTASGTKEPAPLPTPPPVPHEDPSVPKLKLKLGNANSPLLSPSGSAAGSGILSPKIVIKPVLKPAEESFKVSGAGSSVGTASEVALSQHRDGASSPELAKIAYIGKPSKQKGSHSISKGGSSAASHVDSSAGAANSFNSVASANHQKANVSEQVVAPITLSKSGHDKNLSMEIVKTPKTKEKTKNKKGKAAAATPAAKPKPAAFYYDADGNQVWVCPTCGAQDDGTPMIGCDGCDAWYHWVCVGIKSAPDTAKWFCDTCANS